MEHKKNVETPLNEMWKHVDLYEVQKMMEACPIPDSTDYLREHAKEIATKALEQVIHDLAVQVFMSIMDGYYSRKLDAKPWDFSSRLDIPIIKVNVKTPKDLPKWVSEMSHIEVEIIPRKYLPFNYDKADDES